jgi:hypothetical protein
MKKESASGEYRYNLIFSIEAEFVDEIQTKVLRVFPLAFPSHLYSFCLEISISSNSSTLLSISTVLKQKGGKPL